MGRSFESTAKTNVVCHIRCGTTKKYQKKEINIAMFLRQWKTLHLSDIFSSEMLKTNFNYFLSRQNRGKLLLTCSCSLLISCIDLLNEQNIRIKIHNTSCTDWHCGLLLRKFEIWVKLIHVEKSFLSLFPSLCVSFKRYFKFFSAWGCTRKLLMRFYIQQETWLFFVPSKFQFKRCRILFLKI